VASVKKKLYADNITHLLDQIVQVWERGGFPFCSEICSSAVAYFAVVLFSRFRVPVLLVTGTTIEAESMAHEIDEWISAEMDNELASEGSSALVFPSWDIVPGERQLPDSETVGRRLATLLSLGRGHVPSNVKDQLRNEAQPKVRFICTPVSALVQKTYSLSALVRRSKMIRVGDELDPVGFSDWAVAYGYEAVGKVTQRGEIARKGGVLDIWPLSSAQPIRIEFFGNIIESIRAFDSLTQLSTEKLGSIWVPPAGELAFIRECAQEAEKKDESGCAVSFIENLPAGTVVLFVEPHLLKERLDEYGRDIPARDIAHFSPETLFSRLRVRSHRVGFVSELPGHLGVDGLRSWIKSEANLEIGVIRFGIESLETYRPIRSGGVLPEVEAAQRREFFHQLARWQRQGYTVRVFCSSEVEARRFEELWDEYIPLGFSGEGGAMVGVKPKPERGTLSGGFVWLDLKLVVVTDNEIFGRRRPITRRVTCKHVMETSTTFADLDLSELEVGDLVVHATYGIGKFVGLETVCRSSKPQDNTPTGETEYIVIEYAPRRPGDPPPKLYVPLSQAHLVSRYVGVRGSRVKLNTLGSKRWAKTRAQVERAVMDLASELLMIQAARMAHQGYAFGPDTPWQRELEGMFPYEETPDQLKAILETKADMEKPRPMDRLICGDVGFGKTEVAIRAAFKAVMDGKQVAVLAPTTVLAQQHYNTFRERMAPFPVSIELLSRFRSKKEQLEVIERLGRGAVDIVIGTHRLLQDDVVFKDLGLVIIDEEQRFGVMHKEKLKKLRLTVDVLTMTATPIPRTMYLALCGLRDISVIQTPPQDRLPVETFVIEQDDELIRKAILRELARGGQVFYLHNRVNSIYQKAEYLEKLVPEARLVLAHGQMPSAQLERNMALFVDGKADVLLCTTIIENGIDIPRANTIIIDGAHKFGLSQLYQLRGRVGRYTHQAYAYLVLPRHTMLFRNVRQRISTIKQFSSLGSGFKVALRDLEIRGAGNILGPEQSGHIAAVGFDLYCKLLKQAVETLRGKPVVTQPQVEVRFDFLALGPLLGKDTRVTAFLPPAYIPDIQQRIEIYRKLGQVDSLETLAELKRELEDRFGPMPEPVKLLFLVEELKVLARDRQVNVLKVESNKLMISRRGEMIMSNGRFPRLRSNTVLGKLREIKRFLLRIPTQQPEGVESMPSQMPIRKWSSTGVTSSDHAQSFSP